MKKLSLALAATTLAFMPACGDSGGDAETGSPTGNTEEGTTAGTNPTEGGTTMGGGADGPICTNLGGIAGVGDLVNTFLGVVLTDDRINAYFLKSDLDWMALGTQVTDQLGQATGCAGVTYTGKDMKIAHEGLGISMQDFGDFAADFTTAWDMHKADHPELTQGDFDTVIGVLGGMAGDIVEDATDNETIYQRVGRKPGIKGLIGDPMTPGSFVAEVAADTTIVSFFLVGPSDFARLNTCLVRQVIGVATGPDTYGKERDDFPMNVDPGATAAAPCLDMVTSHADLVDDMGVGIEKADFDALVTAFVTAATNAGVGTEDLMAIGGVLTSLCGSIVTVDPEMCP